MDPADEATDRRLVNFGAEGAHALRDLHRYMAVRAPEALERLDAHAREDSEAPMQASLAALRTVVGDGPADEQLSGLLTANCGSVFH